ncbi:ROK family transcriptional regulator [Novosphingobium sp. RD2P27]|uniref:ROK family transcriptional regulator n=1 Tax=Novosphingobium kalidii TaxID=3230299 RepID=A0ABV2CZC5_9SPHN
MNKITDTAATGQRPHAARTTLAVLKALRRDKRISRKDLPGLTGLSAGTITAVTSDLVARGLIVEQRAAGTGKGRPRTYLEIDAAGPVVVGARLSERGELQTAFVDLTGRELFTARTPIPVFPTLAQFAQRICDELDRAIVTSTIVPRTIAHVGLAVPALVDDRTGVVHQMLTVASDPVPLADMLAERLNLPVTVENNANCLVRGEHWFGCAQEHDDFTLFRVGYVLSSARYAGGMPRTGAHGFTPEIGHAKTAYGSEAKPCFCGALGCVSAYCSIAGLVMHPEEWHASRLPPLEVVDERFARLLDDAEQGHPEALDALKTAGEHLGRIVADHVNAADPGSIIILVPDERYRKLTMATFQDNLDALALPAFLRNTRVSFATTSKDWQWKGMAALALEKAYLGPARKPEPV